MKNNKFTVVYTKEERWVVARCVEIDVVSQGKTMKSAERNIREAISLYIESFGVPQIPQYKSPPTLKSLTLPRYG